MKIYDKVLAAQFKIGWIITNEISVKDREAFKVIEADSERTTLQSRNDPRKTKVVTRKNKNYFIFLRDESAL